VNAHGKAETSDCGAEVTESSTNKQHHLSKHKTPHDRNREQVGHTLGPGTVYANLLEGRVVGSSERGINKNPVEECTSRTASVGREISRKILAAETGWSRTEWTPEFLAIEFKRKQDVRSNYVEQATAAAQEQYKSLLTGLQAVGLVKG
jgi:hypothetical protein